MGRSRKLKFEHLGSTKKVKCFVPIFRTMVVFRVEEISIEIRNEKGEIINKELSYELIGEVTKYEIKTIIRNQADIDNRNLEYLRE